ncbi:hypothetical protein [Hylemonella gracilis]|uniref:hypothetical protein n=1 Tax=Hylemonella gracilis TaxID=80880 RepID=UPI0011100D04|nr:hypothetical protein [Hylemonella gracilis]
MSSDERGTKPQSYTLRGRALVTNLPANPSKRDNPLGVASMGRQRSNSIRRLPESTLRELSRSPDTPALVVEAARREIGVRQDMIRASHLQFPEGQRSQMNAMSPISIHEASAVRFAASMAEEAQDEIVREDMAKKIPPKQVGQIAVASVNGHMGVGFSGTEKDLLHIQRVQDRMLDLQQHYDQEGRSGHWSGRLQGVTVSDVFAADDANVCAAKRAAHVAHSMAMGNQAPIESVHRGAIPPPDSLVEMMNPSMSGRGNRLSNFSVPPSSQIPDPDPQGTRTIGNRTRSDSVSNMANSCATCMAEHMEHVSKRGK